MIRVLLFAVIVFIGLGCKQSTSVEATNTKVTTQSAIGSSYPSIDESVIVDLINNCNFIDYIFYELPISLSQNEKDGILGNLKFISREPAGPIPTGCKTMGRKFFQIEGEIVLEADVFLNPEQGCTFYVFYEDGKRAYSNKMTNEGVNFYMNVFQQAGLRKK